MFGSNPHRIPTRQVKILNSSGSSRVVWGHMRNRLSEMSVSHGKNNQLIGMYITWCNMICCLHSVAKVTHSHAWIRENSDVAKWHALCTSWQLLWGKEVRWLFTHGTWCNIIFLRKMEGRLGNNRIQSVFMFFPGLFTAEIGKSWHPWGPFFTTNVSQLLVSPYVFPMRTQCTLAADPLRDFSPDFLAALRGAPKRGHGHIEGQTGDETGDFHLVGGLEHDWIMTFHILGIILPFDFYIFRRGRYTTNQLFFWMGSHEPRSEPLTPGLFARCLAENFAMRSRATRFSGNGFLAG